MLSNVSVALYIYTFSVIKAHQARVPLFGGKHIMLQIQLLFSRTALFVRIELQCVSYRRLPPFESSATVHFID